MVCSECGRKIVASVHEEPESDVLAAGPWLKVGPTVDRRVILRAAKPGEWATNLECRQGGKIDRYSGEYYSRFADAVKSLTRRIFDDLATNSQPGK
jgi:hypothetical protein